MIKVLYDGWSLVRQANSPEALHLLTLLQQRHPEVHAVVALPDQPPEWLPDNISFHIQPSEDTHKARLTWEQRILPRLVRTLDAQLLHLTTFTPPLTGGPLSVLSPAEYPSERTPRGFSPRLRAALASGGMARLRALFWPTDLGSFAPTGSSAQIFLLPAAPTLESSIGRDQEAHQFEALSLPHSYVLYHGPYDQLSLLRALSAWTWAAGPIGEYYPLALLGLQGSSQRQLPGLLAEYNLAETVFALPVLQPDLIPIIYQNCSAVFHPAEMTPWNQTARLALEYGKPLVASNLPLVDALVGPAAYLLTKDDSRAQGAALITVIVEENVAEELSQAGRKRAAAWDHRSFKDELYAAYQACLARG